MMEEKPLVGIVMGSVSDRPVMEAASAMLVELGVSHETNVISAHRDPEGLSTYAREAAGRGLKVIVAGAGMAAHLAGAIAANTLIPVIGVPLASGSLSGLDSLLSTVQMPPGIPVATVAVDGAKNAAVLAAEILAIDDPHLRQRLQKMRESAARKGGKS